MPTRQPLYSTFGNPMHWVDMEWLWGYSGLPVSVRDMQGRKQPRHLDAYRHVWATVHRVDEN